MSSKYATVKVNEFEGNLYPVGSDTPVPANTVIVTTPANFDLKHGDIVIDASGKPWMIDFNEHRYPVLAAVEVSLHPQEAITVDEIEAPMVVVYREGEPVELLLGA